MLIKLLKFSRISSENRVNSWMHSSYSTVRTMSPSNKYDTSMFFPCFLQWNPGSSATSLSTSSCHTSTCASLPYYLSIRQTTPAWKVLPWLFSLPGVVFSQIPSHLTLSPANSNIKVMYNCNSLSTAALPWYHYLFSIVLSIKPSNLLYNLFIYHWLCLSSVSPTEMFWGGKKSLFCLLIKLKLSL